MRPSHARCCSSSPTRTGSRSSAAAARTAATGGSQRGFCGSEGLDAVETTAVEQADVIVDALFGTGFHGEPRQDAAATIQRINAAAAPVVSVDVPSGVDASTGEVAGEAVRATVTVTFHGLKVGLAVAPGRFHTGEAVVADIGLELCRDGFEARHARRPLARAAQAARGQQVQRRLGARRRRRSGHDRRGLSGGRGRLPRRCRLRHGRGARAVTHGGRDAAAGARQGDLGRRARSARRRRARSRSARASGARRRR